MADGSGGGGSQKVTDALKDIGKDLTVNLAKDIIEQIGGSKSTTNQQQDTNQNPQLANIQKNIKIANLSRRIQLFKQRRAQVTQQEKQKEQMRMQQMQNEKQAPQSQKEGKGMGSKIKDIFANWGNTLARRGKGEQRGNKAAG